MKRNQSYWLFGSRHNSPFAYSNRHQSSRGAVIIGVLFFIMIASIMLMGAGTFAVIHQTRAIADANYAAAIDLAEAGIAYEIRKISNSVAQADTSAFTVNIPFGVAGTSFVVQCVNRGTTAAWSGGAANLDILCTGTRNGVSRRVRLSVKSFGVSANYALFGATIGTTDGTINGGATTIQGDVGSNGKLLFNGGPTVTGNVIFNGSGSGWLSPPNGGSYTTQTNAAAAAWPTVESVASTKFASGGITWLATHNDNALAVPAIASSSILIGGNSTVTLTGKAGGANYYLSSLVCSGSAKIAFNNAAGPITIWMGPSGGNGAFTFNGGTAAVKTSTDATKPVTVYSALNSTMTFNGNNELDAGIYNINNGGTAGVTLNGTPSIYGSIIANQFTVNGNPTIKYQSGYFAAPPSVGYYGYDNSWTEENAR